jgi:hypothetical protein
MASPARQWREPVFPWVPSQTPAAEPRFSLRAAKVGAGAKAHVRRRLFSDRFPAFRVVLLVSRVPAESAPNRVVPPADAGENVAMRLPEPSVAALALSIASFAPAGGILLIPDTGADKVWAFSTFDGSLISNNFIPNDGRMKQVMQVAQLPGGTIVMADPGTSQACGTDDAVREYTPCGQFLRTIASAANGVCNPEGICVAYGKAWFTRLYDVASEPTPGRSALWSFEFDGTGLTEACAPASLQKIWGILPFGGGFMVSDSTDNNLEFVPLSCAVSPPFFQSTASNSLQFVQQMAAMPDGGVVAAGFSTPRGLHFLDSSGAYQYTASYPTGARGVFVLENGEVLYSGGTQIKAYNPQTDLHRLIIDQSGASFRWISRIEVCSEDLNCSGAIEGADLGVLLGNWGGAGATDLDGSGTTDGADLGMLLAAWGPCS